MMQDNTSNLLSRLRSFLLPGGEEAARLVRCVRLKEQGELCSVRNGGRTGSDPGKSFVSLGVGTEQSLKTGPTLDF